MLQFSNNKLFISKLELLLILGVFLSIFNIIFNPIATNVNIGILLAIVSVLILNNKSSCFYLPFIVYPFMHLVRMQDPTNVLLILLPDFTVIISIVYYIISDKKSIIVNKYILTLSIKIVLCIWIFLIARWSRKSKYINTSLENNQPKKLNKFISSYNMVIILGLIVFLISDLLKIIVETTLLNN